MKNYLPQQIKNTAGHLNPAVFYGKPEYHTEDEKVRITLGW
jgi:hypothetical protein